jgi:hypothetical protein
VFRELRRPGTLPIVLAVLWAAACLLFFLVSPTTDDGRTLVGAGGLLAFALVAAPLVLCVLPLLVAEPGRRFRRTRGCAMLLLGLTVMVPIPIIFYVVSLAGLGFGAYQLRPSGRALPPAG